VGLAAHPETVAQVDQQQAVQQLPLQVELRSAAAQEASCMPEVLSDIQRKVTSPPQLRQ
jgi:hypothetical protein